MHIEYKRNVKTIIKQKIDRLLKLPNLSEP